MVEERLANEIKNDPKSFYSYIRSKQQIPNEVGQIKNNNGEFIDKVAETAVAFNNFFVSIFCKESNALPQVEFNGILSR